MEKVRHDGIEVFESVNGIGVFKHLASLVLQGLNLATNNHFGYIVGNPIVDYRTLKIDDRHYTLFQIGFSLIQQLSDGLGRLFVATGLPIHDKGDYRITRLACWDDQRGFGFSWFHRTPGYFWYDGRGSGLFA